MSTSIRAAIAALALVPALLLVPGASAQEADCYPVPPDGCPNGSTDGGTDGGGTDTSVESTTSGETDGGTTGGETDGGTTGGETDQPTEVLPTTIDRAPDGDPDPAPPAATSLPRTGSDAGDLAVLAVIALGAGAGAIALTRREPRAVTTDRD